MAVTAGVRTRRRLRRRLAVALCISVIGGLPAPAQGAALVHERGEYVTTTARPVGQTLSLRTRGYYPRDDCLFYDTFCLRRSGGFRPEATAQAKVVQALSAVTTGQLAGRPGLDTGLSAGVSRLVQWEVAPGPGTAFPDSTWAPASDADGEVEETEEDIPNTCPNGDLAGRFRVDVMIDHPAGGTLGIYEVKRWAGPSTVAVVDSQLRCYLAKAAFRGFTLTRDRRLNLAGWTKVYPDQTGELWCEWADPAPLMAGNIYFARRAELPLAIRETIPGCDDGTQELVKKVFLAGLGTEVAVGVTLLIIMAQRQEPPSPRVAIWPVAQPTNANCVGTYTVTVARDPGQHTTLRMEYGDGGIETRTIAQGSGTETFSFSHYFGPGIVYVQQATVLETGATTYAATEHNYGASGPYPVGTNGKGSHLEVTPNAGPHDTPIVVSGYKAAATGSCPGWGTGCPPDGVGQLYQSGPLHFTGTSVAPLFMPYDGWDCNSPIGTVSWSSPNPSSMVVIGTGAVNRLPGVDGPVLLAICADPDPRYLYNYFSMI